ncbi:hypothetical protein C8R43DRAFT_958223 [Mycena crocata]|nr:hypothetical protein C8R43DRAFT_958223 [Mycena crocata]
MSIDQQQADREVAQALVWNPPVLTQSMDSDSPCPELTLPPRAFYDLRSLAPWLQGAGTQPLKEDLRQRPLQGELKFIYTYTADARSFSDVADRAEQLKAGTGPDIVAAETGKRKPPETEPVVNKRQKVDSPPETHAESDPNTVYETSGLRKLALLVLRYGIYNSQNPAAFIRSAPLLPAQGPNRRARVKKHYARHECLILALTSEIERGATGIVHGGDLEIYDEQGKLSTAKVVVKLAFSAEQQAKMRHEYSIYRHMAESNTEGVVAVLGGPLAMVMSHGGTSLRSRPTTSYPDVVVADDERTAYLRVLDAIHAANVRHHDIRPENMLIDDAGRVTIIDFDMAELNPSRSSKKREREHMVSLLNSDYVPPRSFPSAASSSDPEGSNSEQSTDSGEETA